MEPARQTRYTEADYDSLPEQVRAELIDGQFYDMASPSRIHQRILSELHITIGQYIRSKGGGCQVYSAPFAVQLFQTKDTIVEPDLSIICDQSKLTDRGCTGAPDWIIEIVSPSTASHDYVRKLNLYMEASVQEYWIVDPQREKVFVYCWEHANFTVGTYSFQDKIKVNLYDDLFLDFSSFRF